MRIRWSKCPRPARAMSEVEYDRLLDVVKSALAPKAELPKAVNDNQPACLLSRSRKAGRELFSNPPTENHRGSA
jgi:hypothetical protein